MAKLDFTLEKSNNALDTTVSAQQANDRVGYDGVAIKWPVPYELSVTRQLSVRIVSAEPAAGSGETAEGRTGAGQATASRRTESDVSPHKKPELVIRCFDPKASDSLKRQVMLPSTEFSVIPLSRRLFVADRTTLTISNGMLGAVHFARPSDAAGAIGIPKTVLESLASIPLELRNNNTNNINSIIDLKAAEKKLRDGG